MIARWCTADGVCSPWPACLTRKALLIGTSLSYAGCSVQSVYDVGDINVYTRIALYLGLSNFEL